MAPIRSLNPARRSTRVTKTIQLPPEIADQVLAAATVLHRSPSQIITEALDAYLPPLDAIRRAQRRARRTKGGA